MYSQPMHLTCELILSMQIAQQLICHRVAFRPKCYLWFVQSLHNHIITKILLYLEKIALELNNHH